MNYPCPRCGFGRLKPVRSTYIRGWEGMLVTKANFAVWRCDHCGYTRYDRDAIAHLDMLLGMADDGWEDEEYPVRRRRAEGPGERGPHRRPA